MEQNQMGGPASVDAAGLIPEHHAVEMQQLAQAEPPVNVVVGSVAAPVTLEQEPELAPAPAPTSSFNQLVLNVMFTFNLGNRSMFEQKESLSEIAYSDSSTSDEEEEDESASGTVLNLYSPFRKSKRKGVEFPAPDGVLRNVMEKLFNLTDTVNAGRIMYAGTDAEVLATLENSVASIATRIQDLLPCSEDTVVAVTQRTGEDDSVGEDEIIQFGDIVKVRSWVNSAETDAEVFNSHNAVINFVINSGALYDSPDRAKYLAGVLSILTMMREHAGENAKTNVLFAVTLAPYLLADAGFRSLLGDLQDTMGFNFYTRAELHAGFLSSWLPQDATAIDSCVLSQDSDLLLIRFCAPDEVTE
jgi:hypothetical protein